GFCSANLNSNVTFLPSVQPSLRSSCRNASTRMAIPDGVLESKKPMRKTFPGCCASTTVPPNANVKAIAKIPVHFRFWIADFRLSEEEFRTRSRAFSFIRFVPNPKLFNDSIRPRQHPLRNRDANFPGSFQIDHEFNLINR